MFLFYANADYFDPVTHKWVIMCRSDWWEELDHISESIKYYKKEKT